ncbi:S-layer homology domain-containing protein [Nakamurella silvestris]|nr:S-layer homology domain-containing protein [Nakamurella silvestris]
MTMSSGRVRILAALLATGMGAAGMLATSAAASAQETAGPAHAAGTLPYLAKPLLQPSKTDIIDPVGSILVAPAVATVHVHVSSTSNQLSGTVVVTDTDGTVVGMADSNPIGDAAIPVDQAFRAGDHVLTAHFQGNATTAASASAQVPVRVMFTDVTGGPFLDPIQWVATRNVTGGYDAAGTQFKPTPGIARQALAAWFYRYSQHSGNQAPACLTKPAADVPVDSPFCGEIRWMYDQGLTTGYTVNGVNTFHPAETVQRDQAVAFLFRLSGGTTGPCVDNGPFPDVPKSHPLCTAIAWAAGKTITAGYADGGFHPTDLVSRQALTAFLARFDALA